MKVLWALAFALATLAHAEPRIVTDLSESAQPVALAILQHLAAGRIAEAAKLSNEPKERERVLRDYMESVGEDEFRRVYGEYLAKPVVNEFALGARRLVIWQLGERLAGQYYVMSGESFVMDDRPSDERVELRRVLERYRQR